MIYADVLHAYKKHGSQRKAARALGVSRDVIRYTLDKGPPAVSIQHLNRLSHTIENGVVLVGSDAHKWPEANTTAMEAFIKFAHDLQPALVVVNGDSFDGAKISKHAKQGWEGGRPTVAQELEANVSLFGQIKSASPKARHARTRGNHDDRFEKYLANYAPEMEGVPGTRLSDHLPGWEVAWSVWLNQGSGNSPVCIKHRFKGGVHATHSNALYAGVSIVTGHDHMLKITPFSDYWGTRWGVSCGMMAVPYTLQFEYGEDNPENHQSGFQVLTFKNGRLLWPEPVYVCNEAKGLVQFRGEVIKV